MPATVQQPAASISGPAAAAANTDEVTSGMEKLALTTPAAAAAPELEEPQPSEWKLRELNGDMDNETLLKDNPGRYVIFPIQHQDVRTASSVHTECTSLSLWSLTHTHSSALNTPDLGHVQTSRSELLDSGRT